MFLRVVRCSQATILYSKCQFFSDSSRVHPSLIPLCRSQQSWTQTKVKSWPSFSLNLHLSTKMIVSTSSLQCAQHSPCPLFFLTHTKTTLLAVKNKKIFTFLITETVILVNGCKFSEKDCLYFTFIWVHDRSNRHGGIRDG